MSTKDIAEEYARVWQNAIINGDIPPWEAMFDPGFVLHSMGLKDAGLDAYRQHEIDLPKYSQVIKSDIKFVTADRNLFALEYRGHFKLTGDMPGRPGTAGKEFKSQALCLFRVKNGKIVEEWSNVTVTGLA